MPGLAENVTRGLKGRPASAEEPPMTQLMEPRTPRRQRQRSRLRSVPTTENTSEPAAAAPKAPRGPVPRWRRVVPALAIATMVMAYVYASVPFTFAGAIECHQNGLTGTATVAPGTPAGTIIGDMNLRCAEAGSSRIAVAATVAAAAAVVGLAAAFAPTSAEVRARKGDGGPGDGTQVPEGGTWTVPAYDRDERDIDRTVGALSVEELAEMLGGLPVDFPTDLPGAARFETADLAGEDAGDKAHGAASETAEVAPIEMGPAPVAPVAPVTPVADEVAGGKGSRSTP